MKPTEIKKFKNYIRKYLTQNFNMNLEDAIYAVQNSVLNSLLEEDAEMIMHDSISYWAEMIYGEYQKKHQPVMA